MRPFLLVPLLGVLLLAGCDMLGIESPEKLAAAKEAEGKATGSACRHAGRAIEDCYQLNPKALRSAVFAGWREMDEYMRENKIEAVPPSVQRGGSKATDPDAEPVERGASGAADPNKAKPKRAS